MQRVKWVSKQPHSRVLLRQTWVSGNVLSYWFSKYVLFSCKPKK